MTPLTRLAAFIPKGPVFERATGTAGLKIFNLALGLAATILLGRLLRPEQYGYYSFASSAINLLALPVQFGLPFLLMREIAKYQLTENWGLMRGVLLRSNQLVLLLALSLGVLLLLLAPMIGRLSQAIDPATFLWAIGLLPLLALNRIRGAALMGLRRTIEGLLPDNAVRPVLFLIFLLAWQSVSPLRAASAMALQFFAMLLAFAAGAYLLSRHLPTQVRTTKASFATKAWLASIIPLTLIEALQMFNTQADLLLLGFFRSASEVGIYRAGALIALQVGIGMSIANEVLGPYFARLHHAGDRAGMQHLASRATLALAAFGILAAGTCLVAGGFALTVIFGEAYTGGAMALRILALGQLVGCLSGPVALILNMSGRERDVMRVFLVSAAFNLTVNLVLVPHYGMLGAALTTAISQVAANGLLAFYLWKRLGFSVFFRRRRNEV